MTQLLQIKESDPQQLKDIANAFNNTTWTEETFMQMFNSWESGKIEEARQKLINDRGTLVAAHSLFNLIPAVMQIQDLG